MSLAICDHTVLPVTRHNSRTEHTQLVVDLPAPEGLKAVELIGVCDWLHTEMVYPSTDLLITSPTP